MSSDCVDLVFYPLPEDYFDLIYLNGVVQHLENVETGLVNVIKALKQRGYLWVYFYRSGTFYQFVIYLIRDLLKLLVPNDQNIITNSLLLYSENMRPNYFTSNMMDDFLVSYIHLFTAQDYISFFNALGLRVVSESRVDPIEASVDHYNLHHSGVLTVKKIAKWNVGPLNMLTPDKSINQLDLNLYSQPEIIDTIKEYNKLKEVIISNIATDTAMMICFRLYYELHNNLKYLGRDKHEKLKENIINISRFIQEEY